MRHPSRSARRARWVLATALSAAAWGSADGVFAQQNLPAAADPTLEVNPFFSAGRMPAIRPQASIAAVAPNPASRPNARHGLRRLPPPPTGIASVPGSRRLPPVIPSTEGAPTLAPSLSLESPMPIPAPSASSAVASSSKPTLPGIDRPQSPPSRFVLPQLEKNHQDAQALANRPGLGALEDFRLEVTDAELGVVAEEARGQVREGILLAERGAFFSARSNFLRALRSIAQTLDGASQRPVHADALAMGLDALEEADDFTPRGESTKGIAVAQLVASHRTPALDAEQAKTATQQDAQRAYYTFAAEALSRCGGSSETAAEALFQLGKLQGLVVEQDDLGSTAAIPRSMACYHAALAVCPRHARAGNELGFLLAKAGDLGQARAMLQRAVASEPLAEAWHNLAIVHQRLGEADLASQARERFVSIASLQGSPEGALSPNAAPRVTWVAPETMKTPPTEAFRGEQDGASDGSEPVRTARPDAIGSGLR